MGRYTSDKFTDEANFYVPDSTWPNEALEIYEKLKLLTNDPEWKQSFSPKENGKEVRNFLRATEGKTITGASFVNKHEMLAKSVLTLQNWSEGPKGHVHGGLVATVHDSIMGTLSSAVSGRSVTANLKVNYKNPVPLMTTVLLEGKVDKIENRKVFLSCIMTNIDGNVIYSTSTALFLMLNSKL